MSENKQVLIVDDSLVSRMMIKKGIEDLCPDWQLMEAKSGEEALDIAGDKAFDFFSIDFNMPGMDGLELMQALNERFPNARKALLTANIQGAIQEQTQSLGGRVINKPITEESIQKLVDFFNE